jgi:hypothetical protein
MLEVFFPRLDIHLLSSNCKVGVLCFTETWLDGSIKNAEIEVANYVVIRRDRNCGAVCSYDQIKAITRLKLCGRTFYDQNANPL